MTVMSVPYYYNEIFIYVFYISRTLNINARGVVRVSQAVAKNMIDAGIQGSIVNVSSTISEVRMNTLTYLT